MTVKESEMLKWLVEKAVPESGAVVSGVVSQDDAAILKTRPGFELCATTDFVRGTGFFLFQKGFLSLSDLGHYVVGANVSDLAAMGADPLGFLSVVRYRPDRTSDEVEQLLSGIAAACSEYGCPLIGGDTGTYESDVLSGTAFGLVETGRALSRNKLDINYAVFVSGDLGRPASAMAAVSGGLEGTLSEDFADCLTKWKRPTPRLKLGRALIRSGLPIAAMDVSDGLSASLLQLAKINQLGFEINEEQLPISSSVRAIANGLDKHHLEIACGASVDFELLFGAPETEVDQILGLAKEAGTQISHIGSTTSIQHIRLKNSDDTYWDTFPGVPWDHQFTDVKSLFEKNTNG